jgi:hypothetical protein
MAPDAERGLRRTLRSEFEQLEPGLRVLAEDFLGLETHLDLLAADGEGRLVLALVAEPGRELEGIANAMAQAEFCGPRIRDWQKLAPDLPLRPEAEVRASRSGGAGLRARARVLGAGSPGCGGSGRDQDRARTIPSRRGARGAAPSAPRTTLSPRDSAPKGAIRLPVRPVRRRSGADSRRAGRVRLTICGSAGEPKARPHHGFARRRLPARASAPPGVRIFAPRPSIKLLIPQG